MVLAGMAWLTDTPPDFKYTVLAALSVEARPFAGACGWLRLTSAVTAHRPSPSSFSRSIVAASACSCKGRRAARPLG